MPKMLLAALFSLALPTHALAEPLDLPASLPTAVVSGSSTTAPGPNDFRTSDFHIEWVEAPLANVKFGIASSSMEWVRIGGLFVIPRARLLVLADGVRSGQVETGGVAKPFSITNGHGRVELTLALIASNQNTIAVTVNGQTKKARLRFTTHDNAQHVYFDPNCSSYSPRLEAATTLAPNQWAYVSCRPSRAQGLEFIVYWDGVEKRETIPSVWILKPRPGTPITLEAGGTRLGLSYSTRDTAHKAQVGIAFGPYSYSYTPSNEDGVSSFAPKLTLYGDYELSQRVRLTLFDSTVFHQKLYNDFGTYFNIHLTRVLDQRVSINLMAGAHALYFQHTSGAHFSPTLPQGFELTYKQFTFGTLLYPSIGGHSYANLWLRWGTSRVFGELGFVSWREPIDAAAGVSLDTKTFGLSFGFPLYFSTL